MELENGIVVDEVVQTACSQDKPQDHFSRVQRLPFVVDDTLLDELHDTVAHHLRVNAQVLLVLEIVEDRIRDLSDSQLQRRTVFDLPRNIPSYLSRYVRHLTLGMLEDFVRRFDDAVDLIQVDEGVTESARHPRVDLRDHLAGMFGGGFRGIHSDPEAAEPMFVRRGDVNQGHVYPDRAAGEQRLDLAEKDGYEIGPSFVDRLAHIGASKKSDVAKRAGHFRQNVVRIAGGQQMDYGHIAQLGRAAYHGPDELLGFRASGMDVDAGPALNRTHRFIRGAALAPIAFDP